MIAKKMRRALEWRLTTLRMTRHHCSSNLAKLVSTPPDKEKAQMKGLIVSGMLAGLVLLGYFIQVLLSNFTFNCFYIKEILHSEKQSYFVGSMFVHESHSESREDITWLRGVTKFLFECGKTFFNTRREISYLQVDSKPKNRKRTLQGVNDMQIIFYKVSEAHPKQMAHRMIDF